MRRALPAAAALAPAAWLGAFAAPAPLAAQACLGAPLEAPSLAGLAGVGSASHDFADGLSGAEYGVEGRVAFPFRVYASAGVWRRNLDDGPDPTVVRGEAAWSLPGIPLLPSFGLDLCPVAGAALSTVSDGAAGNDFTNWTFPVGLAAGFPIRVGERGAAVAPFAALRWLFSRLEGELLQVPVDERDDSPSLEVGVGATVGPFIGIASWSIHDLDEGLGPGPYAERQLTVKAGLILF